MATASHSPRKRTRKPAEPVLLRRRGDGMVEALSSDGSTIYTLRLGADLHCQCQGFSYRGWCRHLEAASQRYAAFWPVPSAIADTPRPVCLRTVKASIDLLYSDGPEAA
jgi:hypothetical protein